MRVIIPGHRYELESLDGDYEQEIQFVTRFREDKNCPGTINQELLRVLIDRVEFLDKEVPWQPNQDILQHLRMALVLHEARALVRKVEKHELKPESVLYNLEDGHFKLMLRKPVPDSRVETT